MNDLVAAGHAPTLSAEEEICTIMVAATTDLSNLLFRMDLCGLFAAAAAAAAAVWERGRRVSRIICIYEKCRRDKDVMQQR